MYLQPHPSRRHVAIAVGTVATDFRPGNRSFVAISRRLVSICLLIDDGVRVVEHAFAGRDEALLLRNLWRSIKPFDVIIGGAAIESVVAFVCQRTAICGIAPTTEAELQARYSHDFVNLSEIWEGFDPSSQAIVANSPVGWDTRPYGAVDSTGSTAWADGDWNALVDSDRARVHAIFRSFIELSGEDLPDRYKPWCAPEDDGEDNDAEPIVHCRD